MNKMQGLIFGITLVLLFVEIAIAPSSASSDRVIYAFDQNPAGSDSGNEGVTETIPKRSGMLKQPKVIQI